MGSASAGVGSGLPDQTSATAGWGLLTDGTTAYWAAVAGGSGVDTVGTFSGSAQTNGASISGTTMTFGPASATVPGMVSTGTQTWAGAKTFSSAVTSGVGFTLHTTADLAVIRTDTTFYGLWLYPDAASPTNTNFALASNNDGNLWIRAQTGNIEFMAAATVIGILGTGTLDLTGLGNSGSIKLKDDLGATKTATISGGVWVIS